LLDHSTGLATLFQLLPLPGYVGLRGMQSVLERYVRIADARMGRDDAHMRTLVQAIDGSVRVWAGDLTGGVARLREAADEVRWHDFQVRTTLHVYPFLCVADVLMGELAALRSDVSVLERTLMRAADHPELGHRMAPDLFELGRWLHAAGETADALRIWRHIANWQDPSMRPVWRRQLETLPAWLALAEGRSDAAERGFSQALAAFGVGLDIFGQGTEMRLRCAGLRLALGRPAADAAEVLRPVFQRHAGDADLASIWAAGPALLESLALAPWQGQLDTAQQAALERWAAAAAAWRKPAAAAADAPAAGATAAHRDPAGAALSQREWEILGRLAAGDSNKLIARAFDLSPHTVKRHVANILLKLDLRSRGQAAAWHHARHG
jgi:LuxR family transcriptional regulator, maltose regulon positive regulatory protein